jgi:signal peptidase I
MKKVVELGGEDEDILKEKEQQKKKKPSKVGTVIDYILSGCIGVFAIGVFVFSLVVTPNSISEPVIAKTAQVVKSSSMSYRNEKNQYLFDNDLNNQFDTFDLVLVDKLPAEENLKLFDIVTYESNGMLVIHRIIEIEEPNEYHPNCRYFRTQGDAVDTHDKFPVLYEQMRGIYTGEKIPFIGSFILFLQSYAGYICIALIIASSVIIPILDNYITKLRDKRYIYLLEHSNNSNIEIKEVIKVVEKVVEKPKVITNTIVQEKVITKVKPVIISKEIKVNEKANNPEGKIIIKK